MVQGLDGNMWGKVVADGGHQWILQAAGRVAAKADENVRWRWLPSDHPSALGHSSRRKGKEAGAADGGSQQIPHATIARAQAGSAGRGKARREEVPVRSEQQQQLTALQRENKQLQAEVARLAAEGPGRRASVSAGGQRHGRVVTISQSKRAAGHRRRGAGGGGGRGN